MYEYNVNTTYYDEAIKQAREDSYFILLKVLENNETSFRLVMNKCRRYEYKDKEDYDCEEIDSEIVDIEELYDDKEEMIEELQSIIYDLLNT